MQPLIPTIILRHRRENLKKCSLRGLEIRDDFWFFTYPRDSLPDLSNYILLDVEAPPLTQEDNDHGLFLLDATWRYAEKMNRYVENQGISIKKRSIPSRYRTAYPRKQDDCPNPECGLASIEALYVAFHILNRDTSGLLDNYHWKNQFLIENNL